MEKIARKINFKAARKVIFTLSACFISLAVICFVWYEPIERVNNIQKRLPLAERLNAREEGDLTNQYRKTLIEGVSTAAGAIGTVATITGGIVLFLNYQNSSRKLQLDREIAASNERISESRLITERFSEAINQLGSKNVHVRLGGIYSLERIARDSSIDGWNVVEVLTAFIRATSPNLKEKSKDILGKKIDLDVQAALTVVGRQVFPEEEKQANCARVIDLSNTYLVGANLKRLSLVGADLSNSDLQGVWLEEANLSGANLSRANLTRVEATLVNLRGANLRGTDLLQANLTRADLRETLTTDAFEIAAGLLCETRLSDRSTLDPDRDCDLILEVLYPYGRD